MFENLMRAVREASQPVEISIDVPLDEKGCYDRECPNRECLARFKVNFQDWKVVDSSGDAVCPKCGKHAKPWDFNTPEQNEYFASVAAHHASVRLSRAMGNAVRNTRPMNIPVGPMSVTMSLSFKPGVPPAILPATADLALRQDLTCDRCESRFSTVGSGFFCPRCGHNSPVADFGRVVNFTRQTVEKLDSVNDAMAGIVNSDYAADFESTLLENLVEDLISAFQRHVESLFDSLPDSHRGMLKRDANLFQRLGDGSDAWKSAAGVSYESLVTSRELKTIEIMIQRRHKIGHSQAMVDQRYVEKSGDHSYEVGQRLVVTRSQVLQLTAAVETLAVGLRRCVENLSSAQPGGGETQPD